MTCRKLVFATVVMGFVASVLPGPVMAKDAVANHMGKTEHQTQALKEPKAGSTSDSREATEKKKKIVNLKDGALDCGGRGATRGADGRFHCN